MFDDEMCVSNGYLLAQLFKSINSAIHTTAIRVHLTIHIDTLKHIYYVVEYYTVVIVSTWEIILNY